MGSRIKNFLFGKGKPKAKSTSKSNTIGSPYDQYVAADLPVNGNYPIAGNGPNVLEVAQRSRTGSRGSKPPSAHSRWQSRIESPTTNVVPVPAQPVHPVRYHYDEPARPKTAHGRPQTAPNGAIGGEPTTVGWESLNNYNGRERTRSGFTTKSPPPFFTSNEPPPITNVNVHQEVKIHREVQVYQPKRGPGSHSNSSCKAATSRGRQPSNEPAARRPFVDLLDAQSTFAPSRDVSRHRTIALGNRNYGEDVADRNIRHYGTGAKSVLDINSPDLSYLKSLYPPKKVVRIEGTESRAASAVGHVLGHDLRNASDDTRPRSSRVQAVPAGTPAKKKPKPAVASGLSVELTAAPDNDDLRPTTAYESDRRARNFLSPSTITPSDTRPSTGVSRSNSNPSRGRRHALKEPPPVLPPAELARVLSPSRNVNSAANPTKVDRKRRHTLSAATSKTTKNTEKSTKNVDRRTISQSESRSFSLTSLSPNFRSQSISSLKSPLTLARFREEKSPIRSPLRAHPLSNSHSESRSSSLTTQPTLRLKIPPLSTGTREKSPVRSPQKANRYSKSHSESRSFSLTSLSVPPQKTRPSTRSGERLLTKANRLSTSHSTLRSFSLTSTSKPTMAERAGRLPNLEGIVDLTNTVDTDVTTKILNGRYASFLFLSASIASLPFQFLLTCNLDQLAGPVLICVNSRYARECHTREA